jgi:hypothetical protein
MYYSLYTSYEYYENNYIIENRDKIIYENINIMCLICLDYSNWNNSVKNMKEFEDINSSCNCNPYFHKTCLMKWINITSSCPICKNSICLIVQQHNYNNYCNNIFDPFALANFIEYSNFALKIFQIIYLAILINLSYKSLYAITTSN